MKTTLVKLLEAISEIDKLKEAETNLQTAVLGLKSAKNSRDLEAAHILHDECMTKIAFHQGAVRFLLTVASQALLDDADRIESERTLPGAHLYGVIGKVTQ